MLFKFKPVKKMKRTSNEIYLGTISLEVINSWGFPIIDSDVAISDVVIVNYEILVSSTSDEIQVMNPAFNYRLPNGDNTDEYPVLFVEQSNYLPIYCEQQLMSWDFFNRLIDKDNKISKNSTKLMTLRSLRNILNTHVKVRLDRSFMPQFSKDMIAYLRELIKTYPFLGYLSVSERRDFRKASTADATFAWELYIKFFLEEWVIDNNSIRIPQISKPFNYKNWSGNFFDRENPLWNTYVGANKKFKFNDDQRDSIYVVWKEWIKEA